MVKRRTKLKRSRRKQRNTGKPLRPKTMRRKRLRSKRKVQVGGPREERKAEARTSVRPGPSGQHDSEREVIYEVEMNLDRALLQFAKLAQDIKEGNKLLEAAKTKLLTSSAAAPLADQESRTFTLAVSRLPHIYSRDVRKVVGLEASNLASFKSQLKEKLQKGTEGIRSGWNMTEDIVVSLDETGRAVSHLSEISSKAKILVNPKEIKKVSVSREEEGFGMTIGKQGEVIQITGDAIKEAGIPLGSTIIAVAGKPVKGDDLAYRQALDKAGDLVQFTFSLP